MSPSATQKKKDLGIVGPWKGSSKASAQPGIAILSFKVRWLAPRSGGAIVRTSCMITVDSVESTYLNPPHTVSTYYIYIYVHTQTCPAAYFCFSSSRICKHWYAAQSPAGTVVVLRLMRSLQTESRSQSCLATWVQHVAEETTWRWNVQWNPVPQRGFSKQQPGHDTGCPSSWKSSASNQCHRGCSLQCRLAAMEHFSTDRPEQVS